MNDSFWLGASVVGCGMMVKWVKVQLRIKTSSSLLLGGERAKFSTNKKISEKWKFLGFHRPIMKKAESRHGRTPISITRLLSNHVQAAAADLEIFTEGKLGDSPQTTDPLQ